MTQERYFAADGSLRTGLEPSDGEIEISDEEYQQAISGMLGGRVVSVDGGVFAVIDAPASPEPELPEPPEPGVPDRVTRRQFLMQLEIAGIYDAVTDWVETQPRLVQIAFSESGTFVRTDEMLQSGFAGMGFTTEQVDEFFLAASKLN